MGFVCFLGVLQYTKSLCCLWQGKFTIPKAEDKGVIADELICFCVYHLITQSHFAVYDTVNLSRVNNVLCKRNEVVIFIGLNGLLVFIL